jgi:hypothetical protein
VQGSAETGTLLSTQAQLHLAQERAHVLCDQLLLAVHKLLLLSCGLCLSLLLSERLVGAVVHLCATKEGGVVILSVQLGTKLEPDGQIWVDL